MRSITYTLLAALAFLMTFAGVAVAQTAGGMPDGPGLWELARPVMEALTHGHYLEGAALALVLAAALARRYGAKRFPWLATDLGGALLVFVGSVGGAFATALAAGGAPSWGLAWTAVKVAAGAAGGYTTAKRLLEFAAARAPAWMHPGFDVLLWIFGSSSAVVAAEKAGADAVASSPATGAGGVTGDRVDVP